MRGGNDQSISTGRHTPVPSQSASTSSTYGLSHPMQPPSVNSTIPTSITNSTTPSMTLTNSNISSITNTSEASAPRVGSKRTFTGRGSRSGSFFDSFDKD